MRDPFNDPSDLRVLNLVLATGNTGTEQESVRVWSNTSRLLQQDVLTPTRLEEFDLIVERESGESWYAFAPLDHS